MKTRNVASARANATALRYLNDLRRDDLADLPAEPPAEPYSRSSSEARVPRCYGSGDTPAADLEWLRDEEHGPV